MPRSTLDLDAITIASPCTVPWESMTGDDAKRFCGQCRLHVHDFSQMTRAEIGTLMEKTGGDICKRIWRRPDGRVITKDCGRVRLAIERRLRILRTAAAGLLALIGLGGCYETRVVDGDAQATDAPPAATAAPTADPASPKPSVPGATVTTGR